MIVPAGKRRPQVAQGLDKNTELVDLFGHVKEAKYGDLNLSGDSVGEVTEPGMEQGMDIPGSMSPRMNPDRLPPERGQLPDDTGLVGRGNDVSPNGDGSRPFVGGVDSSSPEMSGEDQGDTASDADEAILKLEQTINNMGAAFDYGKAKQGGDIRAGWSIPEPGPNAAQTVQQVRQMILKAFRSMGYRMCGTYRAKDPSTGAPVAGYEFEMPGMTVTKKGK